MGTYMSCGNCEFFTDEDINGMGNCALELSNTHCTGYCDDWSPVEEGQANGNS
jgi:hypothetical protein